MWDLGFAGRELVTPGSLAICPHDQGAFLCSVYLNAGEIAGEVIGEHLGAMRLCVAWRGQREIERVR